MPSFNRETIEGWRAERVKETRVEDGLLKGQPEMMRETVNEDIETEQARLRSAQVQVQRSTENLRCLRSKSANLRKKYGV